MRVMVKFQIPTEYGNDIIRSGKMNQVFDRLMQELKPEAAYFYPEVGLRAGHLICDLADESKIVHIAEAFWFGLGADAEIVPVMNADDLQKGLGGIGEILKNYD